MMTDKQGSKMGATGQVPASDRPLTAGDANSPCPGGWLIKDHADGWYWTDRRIAAVAALTDGHAVHTLSARPAASDEGVEWRCPKCGVAADERHDCCEVYAEQERDRTSEPARWTEDMDRERREADYERGFRHGKERAFDDAGSDPVAWRGRDQDAFGGGAWAVCSFKPSCDVIEPLFAHPAPATADKLRVAKEALKGAREDIIAFATARGSEYEGTREDATHDIDKALAALTEEGSK